MRKSGNLNCFISLLTFVTGLCVMPHSLFSQNNDDGRPAESQINSPESFLWLGNYGTFRISDKFFWTGELHYRRTEYNNTRYIGRMAQIYNRHGINYLFSKNFSATLGGVLRLNFTPEPDNPDFDYLVLEPRIWHEYMFVMPFPRFMVYHRLRFEHRWSKPNRKGSEYTYRNRYRYKFLMKIPLNKPKLVPGAFYFSPDIELIMQSGTPVVDSPFEDLRIFPTFGYIHNPRVKYSAGMMWTTGQELEAGYEYRTRWVFRLNAYISLDFRKFEERIPEVNLMD